MFLAHGPISYLANESIQKEKISGLKNSQQIFLAILSFLFGILIDFDFFLLMILDIPPYTHHDFFTHTPIYWIGLWLLLLLISKLLYPLLNRRSKQFLTKDFLKILLNTFLIAGLYHLLADLLVGNIMVLYPFSSRQFAILRYVLEPSYFTGYFLTVYFAIEMVIIAFFVLHLSRKFFQKQKWDDTVAYILITLSVLYLCFTLFIGSQTYNKSILEGSNKPNIDYDMDYDGIRDVEDWDIDNNGIDNILDAEYEKVVQNAQSIVDSHKICVSSNNLLKEKVLLKYGALTSYRVVSQAFYESKSPIEPVLKNFYINVLGNQGYRVSFDHEDILRQFFEHHDMLIDLNLDGKPLLSSGKIFFLLNKDMDIINMGITLNKNSLAIVLPGEDRIQNHTFSGVIKFYGDSISTLQIVE